MAVFFRIIQNKIINYLICLGGVTAVKRNKKKKDQTTVIIIYLLYENNNYYCTISNRLQQMQSINLVFFITLTHNE